MDGGPTTIGDTTANADGSFTNNTAVSAPGTGSGSADGVVKFSTQRLRLGSPGWAWCST